MKYFCAVLALLFVLSGCASYQVNNKPDPTPQEQVMAACMDMQDTINATTITINVSGKSNARTKFWLEYASRVQGEVCQQAYDDIAAGRPVDIMKMKSLVLAALAKATSNKPIPKAVP